MTSESPISEALAEEILARHTAAARAELDAATAAATAARTGLSSGGVGDVPPASPHPVQMAKAAIQNAMNIEHRSREEAVAVGIGVIMSAAARNDPRVNYTGRTEPG